MSIGHYENFPVGSILVPRRLRDAVHTIYRFARCADDIADEGIAAAEERLSALDALRQGLDVIQAGAEPEGQLMQHLAHVVKQHQLPLQPFYNLLSAFKQDVVQQRYATFDELLDYCRRSANPIGHLMLALYDGQNADNLVLADSICTALQLINFWQDVALDWQKGRVYLPQADLQHYQISEQQIAQKDKSGRWADMMHMQITRTEALLQAGAPLGRRLRGRLGWELRLIMAGGQCIINKLRSGNGDIYRQRPVLVWYDWLKMVYKAI